MLTPSVAQGIEEIRRQYHMCTVLCKEDGQGGAYVVVDAVDLGDAYTPETRQSWIGFHVGFQYPFSDIYPHFVRFDLQRVDKRPFGTGMSGPMQFVGFGRDAVQLSRRSNHRDPTTETALLKLLKVLDWVRAGP